MPKRWLGGPERFVNDGDGREWMFRWGDSGFREEQDNPVGRLGACPTPSRTQAMQVRNFMVNEAN